ncbi:acyltransferase family protein [Leuconostoc pseudomesenteroides]|uniref:acyltransferase family protein n=1 Tax=Leuconostoc pseudomesenteroides TaxID=33968 RepID=UPI00403D7A82
MPLAHKRVYLFEVDFFRIVFILGVLANHTTTLVTHEMSTNSLPYGILMATHISLHFTRMGFMFVTGLVLFMNNYFKPLNILKFWKKRYLGVLVPYLSWTAILTATEHNSSVETFLMKWLHLSLYGDDYYMYYILVTLQLYLVFPVIVWLFKYFETKHRIIVICSAVLQLILLFLIKYQLPNIDTSGWPYLLKNYGFNVVVYQFYFIMGGYAAIHYQEFVAFIRKWHTWLGKGSIICAAGTILLFFYNIDILHLSLDKAEEVHQPFIFVYDIVIIGYIIWLGLRYADLRQKSLPKFATNFVGIGAKISFGIYLSQSLPLALMFVIFSNLDITNDWLLLIILPFVYGRLQESSEHRMFLKDFSW